MRTGFLFQSVRTESLRCHTDSSHYPHHFVVVKPIDRKRSPCTFSTLRSTNIFATASILAFSSLRVIVMSATLFQALICAIVTIVDLFSQRDGLQIPLVLHAYDSIVER